MSPDVKPQQFAVLVRDIPSAPEGPNRKEQVDSYFRTIYPDTFFKSMVVTDNKEVQLSIVFIRHQFVPDLNVLGHTSLLRYRFFFMACEIVFCWNAMFITTNVVPSMKLIMSLVF